MDVAVVGLGKLGAPLAACLAFKGHNAVGVDVDEHIVELLNSGKTSLFEPGLQDTLDKSKGFFRATTDFADAIGSVDLTFVVVPTPSDKDGSFSMDFVLAAADEIGTCLRDSTGFHLIVLTSTVTPGMTEGRFIPRLEEMSSKQCGVDFGVCYNPEFIALGSVIKDMLNPDMILIGESDKESGDLLESLYKEFCDNDPPIARMALVDAELTKLAINTFVTTKIAFANTLARLCERLPGSNVDVVTAALGLDSRIGRKYLTGAIGYGGPCFPRDNKAFSALARALGVTDAIAAATDLQNTEQSCTLASLVEREFLKSDRIAILGLAYKPYTDVVEESQGVLLARELDQRGFSVLAFDPIAMGAASKVLSPRIHMTSTLEECVEQADVLVLVTPWPEFGNLTSLLQIRREKIPSIVDCWRMLNGDAIRLGARYIPLGIGPT